jgi:hypothetical protein
MRTALLLLMITACNKGAKTDGKVASCNIASMNTCVEYRGGNLALGTENLAKLCTVVVSSAAFSETPCPTANVLSTCQRDEGKDFFYQGFEGMDLEKSCTERGGKFAK